ncbi:hypothetical protein HDU96_010075, partial [Phlyctochytrium bullatum]
RKLFRNKLSGDFPSSIASVPTLEYLDISYNAFTGPVNFEWTKLPALNTANFSQSQFNGQLPIVDLFKGKSIQNIDISGNAFSGPIPRFEAPQNLTFLNISRNALTGPMPDEIWAISTLRMLDVPSNHITGLITSKTLIATKFRHLDLSKNRFSGNFCENLCISASKVVDVAGHVDEQPKLSKGYLARPSSDCRDLNGENYTSYLATATIASTPTLTSTPRVRSANPASGNGSCVPSVGDLIGSTVVGLVLLAAATIGVLIYIKKRRNPTEPITFSNLFSISKPPPMQYQRYSGQQARPATQHTLPPAPPTSPRTTRNSSLPACRGTRPSQNGAGAQQQVFYPGGEVTTVPSATASTGSWQAPGAGTASLGGTAPAVMTGGGGTPKVPPVRGASRNYAAEPFERKN